MNRIVLRRTIYPIFWIYERNIRSRRLSALSQATRLQTFRLLVSREPDGVPAGELARLIGVPQNTMSAHLSILANAGLVSGERRSRSIIYRADLDIFGMSSCSC